MKKIIFSLISLSIMLPLVAADSPRKNYGLDPITGDYISGDVAGLINSLKTTLFTQKTDRLKLYKANIKIEDPDTLIKYDMSSIEHLIKTIESAIKNKIVHSDNAIQNIGLLQNFLSEYESYVNRDPYFVNLIKNTIGRLQTFAQSYDVKTLIEKLQATLSIPRTDRLQSYKANNPYATHEQLQKKDEETIKTLVNDISTAIYDKIAYHDFDRAAADIKLLEEFNGTVHDSVSFLLLTTTIGRLKNTLNNESKKAPQDKQKKRFSLFS
ncbi:MAG: hypothetical protein M1114_04990 [Candidatus Dependentiae bacterium]|nr:hypothetical protein [Candidatus Dependentiae bacterium]